MTLLLQTLAALVLLGILFKLLPRLTLTLVVITIVTGVLALGYTISNIGEKPQTVKPGHVDLNEWEIVEEDGQVTKTPVKTYTLEELKGELK